MTTVIYDGSFEGLMTAIFEVFEYKFLDAEIFSTENYTVENIFATVHEVQTQSEKSERVLKKLEDNIGKSAVSQLLMVYLSEDPQLENLIFSAVKYSLSRPKQNVLNDFANANMMQIAKVCKSVGREIHRMNAFVRFEKLQDDFYFAKVEPDFNVLPLIFKHFKARYQDQKWMIFDLKRHYGIFSDTENADFFYPDEINKSKFVNTQNLLHEEELKYQKLWQRYFVKTNIPERKNLKLHVQSLPKRYWKYLTEKY
ncbi:TIGR03915 family putative DNA repair protein [Kaistella jeonii]|uniref:DNA metabolism protein n=1 Tax=Kaistella jeonii TaxID=266749 RepID=A0A0C1FRF3_9FLAO|nr:TIGR03915 family putative DNA repair protein [Kaistella jeonii]KIA90479.1 DNA metabolism protein [Kaistella jeonii]SFB72212.1 probable DNA metabolism protein [Kaistella jeonii]VEI94949.1 probable DNA metabolism protein [Kaistella jeonii]